MKNKILARICTLSLVPLLGETVIGARSYGDWEEIVRQLLP